MEINTRLISLLTPEQAWHYRIFPKANTDNKLLLLNDHFQYDPFKQQELELLFDAEICFETVSSDELTKLLTTHYLAKQSNKQEIQGLNAELSDNYLNKLILEANQLRSSDIHIECYNENARVRFRIDGLLVERYFVNKADYPTLVNRIKILANLDISEKRLPQDGRIFFSSENEKFDIRVSVLPALHGEKIVLRLLKNNLAFLDFDQLGFEPADRNRYQEGIKKPTGIILISGPTGSGKTTTLYATLKMLNAPTKNIITIEDPIEYTLEGINQVQLRENIGLTFASALRTFLRQDPDIIMLGEIRDPETASIAIRASLTGHLVLSTIHTNSAWGIVSRLKDMNIPPYLIADTLNLAVAQRLVRLLCPHCKKQALIDKLNYLTSDYKKLLGEIDTYYESVGCEQCHYTGYKGRKAIYEVIYNNHDFSDEIKLGTNNIDQLKKKYHISSLITNAISIFKSGETTIDEIYPILISTQ